MFRKIEDFQKAWAYETESTLKFINSLTVGSAGRKVTEDGRSLGFLAWHLTQTLGEMLGLTGLNVDSPGFDEECPADPKDIAAAYSRAAGSVSAEVVANWTDETLLQTDEMYGETWERGLTLFYLIAHQTHHRGQMSVLMRQSGVVVPGVYGPSKEEWAAMGAPAMQ